MLRFRYLIALLLLIAGAGWSSSYAQTSGPSNGFGNGGFSSEGSGQLSPLGTSAGQPLAIAIDPLYDFGKVYNGTAVKHTFRLKNGGTGPLTINSVRSSCGCTAARPTKSQLLPGEDSAIAVSFDTSADHGPATRTISVFTNDPKHQQLQLTLRGDVKVQVEASPSLVIFERVKRGVGQSRLVTLTDEMPDHNFKVGAITNTSAHIKVASRPLAGAKPGALLTISLLNTAPAGPITDLIKVGTSRVPVEIPVSGTVLGDIEVNPPQVSFGIVPHHASALRFVRLTNSSNRPVRVTNIASTNLSVIAGVEPLKAGKEYKITVQLRPNTPDGVLRGMLAVKTDDPQQQDVQIPFYGIIGSFRSG